MRLLILGSQGQVGRHLMRCLAPLGECQGVDVADDAPRRVDLTDAAALGSLLVAMRADVIVNGAAYTAVDRAEAQPQLAEAVNATLPARLAEHAARTGALLVHYGTDYVFDGSGAAPRDESAPTAPLSTYGRTKLAGEQAIAGSGCDHLILRTSWVYSAHGGNFPRTMLRLAAQREQLSVVADQVGAPTDAALLAGQTAHAVPAALADPARRGLWHLCAAGETSWHGLACHVLARATAAGMPLKAGPQAVRALRTDEYPTAARRPLNSRLDCRAYERAFGVTLPPWQQGIDALVDGWAARARAGLDW